MGDGQEHGQGHLAWGLRGLAWPGLQCRMDSMTGPVGDWGRIFRIWWLTEGRARPQDGAQISGQMTRPMTPMSGPQDQEQVWGGMSSVWTW